MKSLKQTQEEELETAEPYLGRQAISKLLIKHSMPTRQVFISEITALIREFLLSAMEASARGAIENVIENAGELFEQWQGDGYVDRTSVIKQQLSTKARGNENKKGCGP